MKAETVAGDATGDTLVLAGREGADTDAEALAGAEGADADEPVTGRKPTGAEPSSGTASKSEPAAGEGKAEASSAAADEDSAVRKTPDDREPLDADTASGARTPERETPAKAEALDADTAADTGAEEGTPADGHTRPAQADSPGRETVGKTGPVTAEVPAGAPAPGNDGSPTARADARDEEIPAGVGSGSGADGRVEDEGRVAQADVPDPQGADAGARGADGDTSATADGGAKRADAPDDTAPARRPSWTKGDDQPEEDDTPAHPEADGTATPAGARAPGDGEAGAPRTDGGRAGISGPEGEPRKDGADKRADARQAARESRDRAEAGSPSPDPEEVAERPEDGTGDRQATEGDEAPALRKRNDAGADLAAEKPTGTRAAAQPHDPERTNEFGVPKAPDAAKPASPPEPVPEPPVLEPTRETPRPPLELLAELTNTALPPETPRRTLVRRVKVWTPIVLLLGGAVAEGQMLRPLPTPQLVATQDSVTLDGTTAIPWPAKGQAAVRIPGSGDIGTFGEQKPVPTASVGKVMTAYVILKNHPLRKDDPGPLIEVDAKAVAEGNSDHESRVEELTAGKKFSERDMLKMMMLPSANNIARLLARWDSGNDGAAFVAKMNAAAKELGMRDTTYTDPSGLNSGTVSTAVDQLKLAEAVMQEETFRAIVAMDHAKIEGLPEPIDNSNDLLSIKGLRNIGIKTGSSTPAGGALMWAADQPVGGDTPLILGTMMDQHVDGPDEDGGESLKLVLKNSRKVIEAVRKALTAAPVIHKGQTVGYVSDGLGGRTPLVATKDLAVIGVPGQRLRFTLGTAGGKSVPHEAKAGTEVAVLTVGDGPGSKTVPVAVGTRLAEPSFGTRVTRLS